MIYIFLQDICTYICQIYIIILNEKEFKTNIIHNFSIILLDSVKNFLIIGFSYLALLFSRSDLKEPSTNVNDRKLKMADVLFVCSDNVVLVCLVNFPV